ncbi:hypothetical protein [Candidatus Uabimicrobium sp. HlEnr_7]|uniref:hypothetical protein n=1 Tax=Candidatus Uabimicrobium helgolandensis TaxID=3095367 RepID=UPI003558C94B
MDKLILISIFCCFTFADLGPQNYTSSPPKTSFQHLDFNEIATFNRNELSWKAQSDLWRKKMSMLAEKLINNNVQSVYFVHGTFVGNDPFGTVEYLKKIYPDMSPDLEEKLRDIIKHSNDLLFEDTANFTPEYTNLFSKALGDKIPCHRYEWSSGGYHWARLKSAILLTKSIAQEISQRSELENGRILLVGHSHAGQLFALLTNFLSESKGVDRLMEIASEGGVDVSQMSKWLQQIRKVKLDIVTYGTPPLYGWGEKSTFRLLNIINHRGKSHLAGDLEDGILFTKDGDYIQQIGITGSGVIASNPWEQRLNEKLYPILGPENNQKVLQKNIAHKMRIPHYGKTLLVDFKDASELFPNCITTLFGHGANTRYEKMLFNTQIIIKHFYTNTP